MINKLAIFALAVTLLASQNVIAQSDRSGFDAEVPSVRQAGGYNNYCQTWAVDVLKVQKLFGACTK